MVSTPTVAAVMTFSFFSQLSTTALVLHLKVSGGSGGTPGSNHLAAFSALLADIKTITSVPAMAFLWKETIICNNRVLPKSTLCMNSYWLGTAEVSH